MSTGVGTACGLLCGQLASMVVVGEEVDEVVAGTVEERWE